MPAEATGLFFGENKPRTAMVLKHDLGTETGGLATEDEINKYVESLRTAIDAKYTLLRKAFQAIDKDRNNYLSMDEIFECVRKFALPIPASHSSDRLAPPASCHSACSARPLLARLGRGHFRRMVRKIKQELSE